MTPDPLTEPTGAARGADVLAELKEQFNEDRGVPRLVGLVSPT